MHECNCSLFFKRGKLESAYLEVNTKYLIRFCRHGRSSMGSTKENGNWKAVFAFKWSVSRYDTAKTCRRYWTYRGFFVLLLTNKNFLKREKKVTTFSLIFGLSTTKDIIDKIKSVTLYCVFRNIMTAYLQYV